MLVASGVKIQVFFHRIIGSEQESDERSILGSFPENDKFGLGDGHTLGLEEQIG
jgi:hypothetical protein